MTDHCRGVCNVYRFDAAHPGTVFLKLYANSSEESFCWFRHGVSADLLKETPPAAIKPPGLDPARQWYLYNNIRQFVPDDSKDVLCPRPLEVEMQPSEPAPGPYRATSHHRNATSHHRRQQYSKTARGKRCHFLKITRIIMLASSVQESVKSNGLVFVCLSVPFFT